MNRPRRLLFAGLVLSIAALPVPSAHAVEVAPAAMGLQHFSFTSPTDSSPIKEYHVNCPAGMKVYGGGARVLPAGGGGGNVMISGMEPISNSFGTGFNARAMARPGYGTAWGLKVYAICGNELPGWQFKTVTRQGHGESSILGASVWCDGGRVVVGMGGMVVFGDRKVSLASLAMGNQSLVHAVGQFDKTLGGLTPVFSVRATAICAFEPAGWRHDGIGDSDIGPGGVTFIDSCRAGQLLSIGYSRGDVEGDVYVNNVVPLNLTTAQIAATPRSPSNLWTFWGDLICAT